MKVFNKANIDILYITVFFLILLSWTKQVKYNKYFSCAKFINRDNISNDISDLTWQYAHVSEPIHHIAYMFNDANKLWCSQ